MRILYLALVCPKSLYRYIEDQVSQAAYQFNRLLSSGLSKNRDVKVDCILPQNVYRVLEARGISCSQVIKEQSINYYILGSGNRLHYIKTAIEFIQEQYNKEPFIIICDSLSITFDIISIFAKKRYGIGNAAIVTDLPKYVGLNDKRLRKRLADSILTFLIRKFDSYVLLTKEMGDFLKIKSASKCIMEGICDIEAGFFSNKRYIDSRKRVCLYAGSLHKQYGIAMLIEAFRQLKRDDIELHIYGNGNYAREIEDLCSVYDNIRYFGLVSHEKILEEERRAYLLINPRPTHEEFTKYSFPSKNLEYMASGTPLLTTRLPGMPDEYIPYVYLLEEETEGGFAKKLSEILNKPAEEVLEFGNKARKFVLEHKNNIVQAERILAMLQQGYRNGEKNG